MKSSCILSSQDQHVYDHRRSLTLHMYRCGGGLWGAANRLPGWTPDHSAGCSGSAWRSLPPFEQLVGHTAVSDPLTHPAAHEHVCCFRKFILCTGYMLYVCRLRWISHMGFGVQSNTIATCTYTHPCVFAQIHSLTEIDSLPHTCWYKNAFVKKRECKKMRL